MIAHAPLDDQQLLINNTVFVRSCRQLWRSPTTRLSVDRFFVTVDEVAHDYTTVARFYLPRDALTVNVYAEQHVDASVVDDQAAQRAYAVCAELVVLLRGV